MWGERYLSHLPKVLAKVLIRQDGYRRGEKHGVMRVLMWGVMVNSSSRTGPAEMGDKGGWGSDTRCLRCQMSSCMSVLSDLPEKPALNFGPRAVPS